MKILSESEVKKHWVIRHAHSHDSASICRFRKASWVATYQKPAYQEAIGRQDFTSDKQVQHFSHSLAKPTQYCHWVAAYEDEIIGWAAVELHKNEMIAFYVHPDYQGQGIGSQFYHLAYHRLDRARPIILYVVVGNDKAVSFYHKRGFTILSTPSDAQCEEGLKSHQLPLLQMQLAPKP